MSDKISIFNNALIESHVDATITNVNEKSPEAERCNRIYDFTRKELLSMYPWTFARKYVKLARIAEDVEGYKYAYMYPTEALRINDIYVDEVSFHKRKCIPFEQADAKPGMLDGNKVILCDYEEPFISENIDIETESLFPEHFCRLLYLYMADKIAKMSGATDKILDRIASNISTQLSFCATVSNREDSQSKDNINYYVDVRN